MSDIRPRHGSTASERRAASFRIIAVMIALVWGGNMIAMRIALVELPPFLTAAIRSGLTALTLFVWTCIRGDSRTVNVAAVLPLLMLGVLAAATFGFLYTSMLYTSTTHVTVLLYLYPVLTVTFAHVLLPGESMTLRAMAGLALGFVGAALTLTEHRPTGTARLFGDVLAVSAAFLWALQTVLTKRLLVAVDPVSAVMYPALFCAITFVAASAFLEPSQEHMPSRPVVAALVYQGVVVSAASSVAWLSIMRHLGASRLSSYSFLAPASGVLAANLALGETIPTRLFAGAACVAMSLGIIEASHCRKIRDESRFRRR